MPAWIAALSPDTVMIAIAAVGGVMALLLLVAAVRRLRDWRIPGGVTFLLLAFAVAALATAGAMLAASLHTYSRLTEEQEAARAVFRELAPRRYELLLVVKNEPPRAFEIRASGLPGILVWGEGITGVPAATSRMVPVRVRVEPGLAPGSYPVEFTVTALGVEGVSVREPATFVVR